MIKKSGATLVEILVGISFICIGLIGLTIATAVSVGLYYLFTSPVVTNALGY